MISVTHEFLGQHEFNFHIQIWLDGAQSLYIVERLNFQNLSPGMPSMK